MDNNWVKSTFLRWFKSQVVSGAALAIGTDSAFSEERAIQLCFFAIQYIGVSPDWNRLPVIDFLSCLLVSQTESGNDAEIDSSFCLVWVLTFLWSSVFLLLFPKLCSLSSWVSHLCAFKILTAVQMSVLEIVTTYRVVPNSWYNL